MQERDECCRWNGTEDGRRTQIHNTHKKRKRKGAIFSYETHFLPVPDFKHSALARLKLNERNKTEQIDILSGEIIAFEIILCLD